MWVALPNPKARPGCGRFSVLEELKGAAEAGMSVLEALLLNAIFSDL